jgi:hypothetical protein
MLCFVLFEIGWLDDLGAGRGYICLPYIPTRQLPIAICRRFKTPMAIHHTSGEITISEQDRWL